MCELPSLLVPGRPDTRPHSAEARPLQEEAPTRRRAGSQSSNGSPRGGADAAWACAEVGIRGQDRKSGGGAWLQAGRSLDTPGPRHLCPSPQPELRGPAAARGNSPARAVGQGVSARARLCWLEGAKVRSASAKAKGRGISARAQTLWPRLGARLLGCAPNQAAGRGGAAHVRNCWRKWLALVRLALGVPLEVFLGPARLGDMPGLWRGNSPGVSFSRPTRLPA